MLFINTAPILLAALSSLASIAMASPLAEAKATIERRDSATCVYFQDWDGLRYEITIDSAQDAGVCDGIHANLRCSSERWGCSQNGSVKTMSFTLLGCNPGEVERAIYLATSPHLEGVKCVSRG